LRAIRENLSASAPHDELQRATREGHEGQPLQLPLLRVDTATSPPLADASLPARVRFQQRLEAVGGRSVVARDEAEAASVLAAILAETGAHCVAGSDAPLVERLLSSCRDRVRVERVQDLSRDDLFSCDVGVTTAQWGIAETGTLVLESGREKNRLLSLVPPVHVALLRTRCICDSLADALARVHSGVDAPNRAITFITGPSRTSDIELTLTIGVHGPQTLHVILLEDAT
jgi:L-lactate utilization protein LutC